MWVFVYVCIYVYKSMYLRVHAHIIYVCVQVFMYIYLRVDV